MMATEGGADVADRALLDLLHLLGTRGYRFVTPTPATHGRVIARPDRQCATSIEDVLGWSLPFADDSFDPEAAGLLRAAGAIFADGPLQRSDLRVSSLDDRLFLHAAYPTDAEDAVFFGPDSYRFADLIKGELDRTPPPPDARMADIGTGAGIAAALLAGRIPGGALIATDTNPKALRLARINLAASGLSAQFIETAGLAGIETPLDLVTINPPYILDDGNRTYRDGGGMHGGELSLDLAREAMSALAPGGRLLLYTGSAIVRGGDALFAALRDAAQEQACTLRYREIDPDVFGEELDTPGYADVDRIAAVAAVFTRVKK